MAMFCLELYQTLVQISYQDHTKNKEGIFLFQSPNSVYHSSSNLLTNYFSNSKILLKFDLSNIFGLSKVFALPNTLLKSKN